MPVKSRFSSITLGGPFILGIVAIAFAGYYFWAHIKDVSQGGDDVALMVVLPVIMLALIAVMIFGALRFVNFLRIDAAGVTYLNILTRKKLNYKFSELDGYIIKKGRNRGVEYEIFQLVKDGKEFGPVSSSFYSNYDQLKGALRVPCLSE